MKITVREKTSKRKPMGEENKHVRLVGMNHLLVLYLGDNPNNIRLFIGMVIVPGEGYLKGYVSHTFRKFAFTEREEYNGIDLSFNFNANLVDK